MLEACLRSLTEQKYPDVEIVMVVDGDRELADIIQSWGSIDILRVNENNRGLLESRNAGASAATGDIIAFIDDDATASPWWIAELVRVYEAHDALAAGGKLLPEWESDRPRHLPHEFDWLVGATHRGFAPEEINEVRNTFGSNISFRAGVFDDLGGFDTSLGGRQGNNKLQAGETELCARLIDVFGEGVYYSPEALVYHTVPDGRARFRATLRRAYWQGISKCRMEKQSNDSLNEERAFLTTVTDGIKNRLVRLLTLPTYTAAVGIGYLHARVRLLAQPSAAAPESDERAIADGGRQ